MSAGASQARVSLAASPGFTLIELVVALALSAVVMLGLVSALASFGKTATTMERKYENSDELRLVSEFIRSTLSRGTVSHKLRLPDNAELVYFRGGIAEVRWLGVMPPRHGVGGLQHMRLAVSASSGATSLIFQATPFFGEMSEPDWTTLPAVVLVDRLAGLALSYLDPKSGSWRSDWWHETDLPESVRVELATQDLQHWPTLVVRVRAGSHAADATPRAVHGPV